MEIAALFRQTNALPSAPKVVQELISSFNDENISADYISRRLATDPVLSAKLLRLANSAYYRLARRAGTVNEAVAMLGFGTVRALVISSSLVNGFKSTPGFDMKQFWRYSLNTAVLSRWLAKKAGEDPELAFTVGMTHAIGQLVLHICMPEQTMQLDKTVSHLDANRIDAERNAFGYDYAEVGAELAARWNFPETLSHAIGAFPKPLEYQPFNRMGAIIHLAAWFAKTNESNQSLAEVRAAYPTAVNTRLGLDTCLMLDSMPPLSELCSGLEELVA